MSFKPSFPIGSVVSNSDLADEFVCSNQGGMRRSHKTNTLVIVTSYVKSIYEDKWFGDVLHYTGMGLKGDQDINFAQNKTLAESDRNGVDIHLFEVFTEGEYLYRGQAELCELPYQAKQKDEDGALRSVWIFPIYLLEQENVINRDYIDKYLEKKEEKARKLSTEDLKEKALDRQSSQVSTRPTTSNTYVRDPYIAEYVKRLAKGICQLCEGGAPFKDNKGKPYLETHHIVWLANGGSDTLDNTVALCPNCHRKMHVIDDINDVERLRKRVEILVNAL